MNKIVKLLILPILAGSIFWALDGVLDYMHAQGSLQQILIYDLSQQELFIRAVEVSLFIALALFGARLMEKNTLQLKELKHSGFIYSNLFESIRDAIMVTDSKGIINHCNRAFTELFGYRPEEINGMKTYKIYHHIKRYASLEEALEDNIHNPNPLFTVQYKKKSGEIFPGETNVYYQYDQQGNFSGFVALIRDVTEREKLKNSLHTQSKQFYDLLKDIYTSIIVVDPQGVVLFANPAAQKLLGRAESTILNSQLGTQILNGSNKEIDIRRPDGKVRIAEVLVTKTQWQGKQSYVIMLHDITERKNAEQELQRLAHYDALTGLPNRLLLNDRLEQSMSKAQRYNQKLAVVSVDLDRLKSVNDALGHEFGDVYLKKVAERLQSTLRKVDTVARMGGDEFLIVLENIKNEENAEWACGKIHEVMQHQIQIKEHTFIPECSIGFSLYPDHGTEAMTLIRYADAAMYRAKESGRNRVCAFFPSIGHQSSHKLTMEHDLRRAIKNKEFVLYYQPQFKETTGQMVGLEALLRWDHSNRGIILPGEFIEILEETGLIIPVGKQVIEYASKQMNEWYEEGLNPPRIAINVSAKQLYSKDFVEHLTESLNQSKMHPGNFVVELTETAIMQDVEQSGRIIKELRQLGIKIALDDFGTGYATLRTLYDIDIDIIKIDRLFVSGIPDDEKNTAIIKSIIAITRNMGKELVVEGVESKKHLEILKEYGCDLMQGFLLSRPQPPEEIERQFLRTENYLKASVH